MRKNRIVLSLSVFVLIFPWKISAQHHPVTLQVIDKTFGVKTSNHESASVSNVVAGLSSELKFQGKGIGNWYYPLFEMPGTTGRVIRNDTAWIWEATIQAPVGTHSWTPCMKSAGYKPLNKVSAYYGEDDALSFTVDASGKVEGTTKIVIEDTAYPVTLKVVDKTKGAFTDHADYPESNVYFTGGKPLTPANACTDLHDEFVVHHAKADLASDAFDFQSGVNIGVWLSQTSGRGSTKAEDYFTKNDLKQLADMGFDHIRLPVDEKEIFDTQLNFIPSSVKLIHNAIAWCEEYGMRMVLDFHIIRSHYFNDDKNNILLWKDLAEQDKLVDMWDKLSREFGNYPNSLLAYELLNEVNAPNAELWNSLSARIIAKIREREPDRYLILGGISHNSAAALSTLTVPANDKRLMLAFHFYSPHLLTHYQAPWMSGLKNLSIPLHYPGQLVAQENIDTITIKKHRDVVNYYNGYNNKSTLLAKMKVAIERGKELGLKLYCSEYGCISNAPEGVKERWMRDVAQVFRENEIAFSVWGWKASFGILDEAGNVRNESVIRAITEGGGDKYDLFPLEGNSIEKNDTAWIWSATIQARTGCYTWMPSCYSDGKVLARDLQFNVDVNGNVSGKTVLVIPETESELQNMEDNKSLKVYPTLFSDCIYIKGAERSARLYTSDGVKVLDEKVTSECVLDTSGLFDGFYVLLVDDCYGYKLKKQ